ncbi:MAG: MFS transporter [Ktedonobacteraceae bacterium]|nr:MFS transporter [Chloroflexota bacterium]
MSSRNEDTEQAKMSRPAGKPVSLWLNRDYMLLWSGQAISLIGTEVSQFAFPLLVLAITRSPALAGIAGAVSALPYLILSLPAGALIDRWDRKRVMILCDTGRALNMASIPIALLLGHLTLIQIYLVALIEGSLFVFFNLAQAACLPRLVPNEQLPTATAQNEATYSTSSLLSPSLGGVLYSVRQVLPFTLDAISYAFSVISLLFIRTPFQKERITAQERPALRHEIARGLVWLWRQPLIRYIAFLTGGFNLLGSGIVLVVIVLAQHQGASSTTIGIIFSIAGIGSILGSLVGGFIQKRFRFGTVMIILCWLPVLLWPLYAIVPNVFLLGVVTAGLLCIGPIYNVVQFSYRLALIPDELQGRVNSVFRLIAFGFIPLGQALAGFLLQSIGTTSTILLITAVSLLLAITTTLQPLVRHARPIEELETA